MDMLKKWAILAITDNICAMLMKVVRLNSEFSVPGLTAYDPGIEFRRKMLGIPGLTPIRSISNPQILLLCWQKRRRRDWRGWPSWSDWRRSPGPSEGDPTLQWILRPSTSTSDPSSAPALASLTPPVQSSTSIQDLSLDYTIAIITTTYHNHRSQKGRVFLLNNIIIYYDILTSARDLNNTYT